MGNKIQIIDKNNTLQEVNEEGFVLLIDKEAGWTSFDVVAKLRNILGTRKIGHAGTLDPFATGLLLLLVGKATKVQEELTGSDKVYEAELKLGERTDTFDPTGTVTAVSDKKVSEKEIMSAVMSFSGEQMQLPPMFSAIKKDGKRLYESARKGIEVEREPRKITIHSIEVSEIKKDIVRILVNCSKGTYIRTLADDIGEKLSTYAHLKNLRRISIGSYRVENAFTIGEISGIVQKMKTSGVSQGP
ncbi:TPA: tRNA pseudouridine(55) synthase TruB [Candidatus Delongbacteria bacterium]|nr:tRNA pseudouridine(55) synthase TruB [Candidatus Delongbacteria bacterium]